MSVSSLPALSDDARTSCPNCGAALAADQRYCLACGQPSSPVRLAFLDVLQAEHQPQATAILPAYHDYPPTAEQDGAAGWLRRYSGIFGLLTVLLLAVLLGLLMGHWISQSKTPAQQILRVEYPNGAPALAQAGQTSPATGEAGAQSATAANQPAAKAEAAEAKEAASVEKKPPPPPVKANTKTLQNLASSKGRQHQREIEKLGDQPIETGGGSGGSSTPKTPAKPEGGKAGGGSGFQTIE